MDKITRQARKNNIDHFSFPTTFTKFHESQSRFKIVNTNIKMVFKE